MWQVERIGRFRADDDRRHEAMAIGLRRILVIEDDQETAAQLVDSLASSGYEVDLAIDGADGLSRRAPPITL